jgi:hypothetical protein
MTLRIATVAGILLTGLTIAGAAQAKKNPEEQCADFKPDRTLAAESSNELSGRAEGKGWGVNAAAEVENNTATAQTQQEIPEAQLRRAMELHQTCLLWAKGMLSDDDWQAYVRKHAGLGAAPPPKAKKPSPLVQAMANAAHAAGTANAPKRPKVPGANLVPAAEPCGRYAGFGLHVPKRYARKSCKDEGGKSRFVFTSPQAKGATCSAMHQWAVGNGFKELKKDSSPAKDEIILEKSGMPKLTIKCVNFPRESGKPTRLVFLLAP